MCYFRYLHIPLVSAERAWAYAMDIKNEIEQDNAPNKRNHMIRRLAKACVHATEVLEITKSCCDTRSQFEAESYSAWMCGTLYLERGKDWGKALSHFHHASSLLNELFKVSDYDQRNNIRYLLEQVEPAVRFCEYQLGRAGKSVEPLSTIGSGSLASKLESLAAESEASKISENLPELEWNGEVFPIRDERCKVMIHSAQQLAGTVESTAKDFLRKDEREQEEDIEKVIQLYDKAINAYDDARGAARSAGQLGSLMEEQQVELVALARALQGLELQMTIERNGMFAKVLENRLTRSIKRRLFPPKSKDKSERPARPEEIVRVYETLIANVTSLNDLAAEIGGAKGEILMDLCSARIAHFQASRCYFVAHKYLSDQAYQEAFSLFLRVQSRVKTALERFDECTDVDEIAKRELNELLIHAQAYKFVAEAELRAMDIETEERAVEGVETMNIEDTQRAKRPRRSDTMVDNIDCWVSYAGDEKNQATIAKVPPAPSFLPVRPIVLDTALMSIKPPKLTHRFVEEPSSTKSVVSRLFGWS